MGIGKSRERFGQRPRSRSPGIAGAGQQQKRRYFRRRQSTVIPTITQPLSYQPFFGGGFFPSYGRVQPISSPYLPIAYNSYSAPAQVPPQYMMMMPPSIPSPYASIPYAQQAPIQPVYNNIGYPGSIPGGNAYYPLSYPVAAAAPTRLITDWTGGGKISPGFLGPPL